VAYDEREDKRFINVIVFRIQALIYTEPTPVQQPEPFYLKEHPRIHQEYSPSFSMHKYLQMYDEHQLIYKHNLL